MKILTNKKMNKMLAEAAKDTVLDFPFELEIWPAGNGFDKDDQSKICPLFPYWDKERKYIYHSIGEIVPLFKVGYHTALYEIVDWKVQGNDHAGFDDGRWYTVKFKELCRYDLDKRLAELNKTND